MKRVIALSMLVLSLSIASPLWAQEESSPATATAAATVNKACDPGIAEIVGPKRYGKDCRAFQKDLRFARFEDFEEHQYNRYFRQGPKLRNIGIVLTSIGSGVLIASVVLLVRGHRLNDAYHQDHPDDPDDPYDSDNEFLYGDLAGFSESLAGVMLLFPGVPLLVAGVSMLIPGIHMKKRATAVRDYLHQKPTAPVAFTGLNLAVVREGVGFGMTLSF